MRNLFHLTLTLLLGLILSSSSCSKDPDPIFVPPTQDDFYGVWKTGTGTQVEITLEKIILLVSGGAKYTMDVNVDGWTYMEHPNFPDTDYPTGYTMVGTMSVLSSINICNEDETGTTTQGQIGKLFWYLSKDKTTLKFGHNEKPHFPVSEPFTK